MALPQLTDVSRYDVVIPSSGVKTQYRPYLVKEEKVLLIALESQDEKQILNATVNLITECLNTDNVNVDLLTVYDIEYLFTQIRSKSVGETIAMHLICQADECDHVTETSVALDSIEVEVFDRESRNISITEDISIEMRHLPYKEAISNTAILDPSSFAEQMFSTVISCIEAVCTEDERMLAVDSTKEELINFVEALTASQFSLLRTFVENTPTIVKEIEFKCSNCETDNKYTLAGLQDFFE